jgi:hypothetical protein
MDFDAARVKGQESQTRSKQPAALARLVQFSVDVNQARDAAQRARYVDLARTTPIDLGVHRGKVRAGGCALSLELLLACGELLFLDQSLLY